MVYHDESCSFNYWKCNQSFRKYNERFETAHFRRITYTIKRDSKESRKEWLLAGMEKTGKENSNNCGFQLWQQHNQPIVLDTSFIAHQKLDYLHNNPVTAGFVEKPEDWL